MTENGWNVAEILYSEITGELLEALSHINYGQFKYLTFNKETLFYPILLATEC